MFVSKGMGWIPDLPDPRDYTLENPIIRNLLGQLREPQFDIPDFVDLRKESEGQFLTSSRDQGSIQSSSAFAALGLIECFRWRLEGTTFNGSPLFLYKVSRNLARRTGDCGSDLRTTIKACCSIGVPPEGFYPYSIVDYDNEPSSFVYSLAKPEDSLVYFRLDSTFSKQEELWRKIKSFLAAGFPIAFGFSVPTTLPSDGNIVFRRRFDQFRGGQACIAVGYRDDNPHEASLLFQSSWGEKWGDKGYGWLPSSYIKRGVARDFWTFISKQWIDKVELWRPSILVD